MGWGRYRWDLPGETGSTSLVCAPFPADPQVKSMRHLSAVTRFLLVRRSVGGTPTLGCLAGRALTTGTTRALQLVLRLAKGRSGG